MYMRVSLLIILIVLSFTSFSQGDSNFDDFINKGISNANKGDYENAILFFEKAKKLSLKNENKKNIF